ncbi:ATP-binding cassette domain-containing protein [Paenibacillus sp. CAU 1782]
MDIRLENVSYRYPDAGSEPAAGLEQLNLTVKKGSFTVVLGAPGSGKSTLLQHLNGLLLPMEGKVTSGDITLSAEAGATSGGNKPRKRTRAEKKELEVSLLKLRRSTGLVFQFPEKQLFEETVLQDITFGPLNFGYSPQDAEEAARNAAGEVELDAGLLDKSPFQLSGGQMRKAAIASVLASGPQVIALDEPTASLDQQSREELLVLLKALCRDEGKTILIVTHRLEEVLPYGDDFVVISKGRRVFQGPAGELLERRDMLEEAGIAVPQYLSLLEELSQGMGVPLPKNMLTPKGAARWIADALSGQKQAP